MFALPNLMSHVSSAAFARLGFRLAIVLVALRELLHTDSLVDTIGTTNTCTRATGLHFAG
jgi:hypothetical protein